MHICVCKLLNIKLTHKKFWQNASDGSKSEIWTLEHYIIKKVLNNLSPGHHSIKHIFQWSEDIWKYKVLDWDANNSFAILRSLEQLERADAWE